MDVTDKIMAEFFPGKSFSVTQKKIVKKILGVENLLPLLQENFGKQGVEWIESIIDSLNIRCETHCGGYDNIPAEGPVIVIANHPTVMDGLALITTLARVRKDIKIVANHVLTVMFPEVKNVAIGIRNMQGKMGHKQLKAMNDHLKQGGVLVICPAGRLASITPFGLKESRWQEGFLRLALKNNAALVPVHISGSNSILYYLAAIVWRPLSNLMIFREILRHKNNKLSINICQQLDFSECTAPEKITEFAMKCRKHLLLIGQRKVGLLSVLPPIARSESRRELLDAINKCYVLKNISSGKQLLLYRYHGESHSPILSELGRLREISFRETGAGTGKKRDNDIYDLDYYHIILWDGKHNEIVGAYRLMLAGEQIEKKGVEGLYSNSLFNYKSEFFPQLEKTIEVGRGFVQKRYQKTKALDHLWKGIFYFSSAHPNYVSLIGVLTIPEKYPTRIKQLIVYFYKLYFLSENEAFDPSVCYKIDGSSLAGIFAGDDFDKDWKTLNNIMKESGNELPWPYKQAAKWYNPGGSVLFGFVKDNSFNSIAGLNFCAINELKEIYYSHYIARQITNEEVGEFPVAM